MYTSKQTGLRITAFKELKLTTACIGTTGFLFNC